MRSAGATCVVHSPHTAASVMQNLNLPPARRSPMQIACLPYASSDAALRRVLSGTAHVDAVVLPAAAPHDGGKWLQTALRQLRRELFLEPELQVLASVEPLVLDDVTRDVAEMLCEARCEHVAIAKVKAVADTEALVEWLATGEELRHAGSGIELDDDVILHSASIELGAAPVVEACESGSSVVLAGTVAPGTLALAAAYSGLMLGAQDWDRLATASAVARLVEQPGEAAPLWMTTDNGAACIEGLPTLSTASLEARLAELGGDDRVLRTPDVVAKLAGARVTQLDTQQFGLEGIEGQPPVGRSATVVYHWGEDQPTLQTWPTTVASTLVDWDSTVRTAGDWLRD